MIVVTLVTNCLRICVMNTIRCLVRVVHSQIHIQYTYFHDLLGRYSVTDHVFVGKDICGNVIKYETTDSRVNLLDYVPVSCRLAIPANTDSGGVSQHCSK